MLRLGNHTHLLPIFGSLIWGTTLIILIIVYFATGRPQYASQNGKIPYISDIAASSIKPFFIVGCSITAFTLITSLCLERWFRHRGRLAPNLRKREKVMGVLSIIGSLLGGAGLVLLSVFDTLRFMTLHRVFLFVFMLGVAMSALFTVIEYALLAKYYSADQPRLRHLKASYIAKAIIVTILVLAGVAFYVLLVTGRNQEAAAIIEWIIAFGLILYLLTFWYDLRQARGVRRGYFFPSSSHDDIYGDHGHPTTQVPDSAHAGLVSTYITTPPPPSFQRRMPSQSKVPQVTSAAATEDIRPISRGDSSFESPMYIRNYFLNAELEEMADRDRMPGRPTSDTATSISEYPSSTGAVMGHAQGYGPAHPSPTITTKQGSRFHEAGYI